MRPTPSFRSVPTRVHLSYPRPAPGPDLHANLYRFGQPRGPRPLLCYVGGAIDEATYAARASSEPLEVLEQLSRATQGDGLADHDFLVCPALPVARETGVLGQDFLRHLRRDLLPALGAPPSAIGFVGYSVGAYLAAYAAFRELSACALAMVGASNPADAMRPFEAEGQVEELDWDAIAERLRVEAYRNVGDPSDPEGEGLAALPASLPLRSTVLGGPGDGHRFDFYAKTGGYKSAFRFALRRMNRAHAGLPD